MKNPSPKIVLVTSVMSFKPPFYSAAICEEGRLCLRWVSTCSRWNKQINTGEEIARRAQAWNHCRWEGKPRRKEQKRLNCRCFFGVSESCLHGSQDPPRTLLSFPLINPACMPSQLRSSLTLALPECFFSHPLSTHCTARHCAKCFMLAIPVCLHDAEISPKCPFVKWAFYLHLTTFLNVFE